MSPQKAETKPLACMVPDLASQGVTEQPDHTLRVTMISAAGLRKGDWVCVCESTVDAADFSLKSPPKNATSKPVWNFTGERALTAAIEGLSFIVNDDFGTGTEMRGKAMLYQSQIYPNGYMGELRLDMGKNTNAILKVKVEVVMPPKALAANIMPAAEDATAKQTAQESPAATKVKSGRSMFAMFGGRKKATAVATPAKASAATSSENDDLSPDSTHARRMMREHTSYYSF